MVASSDAERLTRAYPLIYLACHRRHILDDANGRRLTAQQIGILDHLEEERPTTVGQLAAHMNVTEATMSIHLKRLSIGGYVVRKRKAEDKRIVLACLSKKGVEVRQQNSMFEPELVRELLSLVPASKRDSALSGLEILGRAALALMQRRSAIGRKGRATI